MVSSFRDICGVVPAGIMKYSRQGVVPLAVFAFLGLYCFMLG
jgi:hypothetical protein